MNGLLRLSFIGILVAFLGETLLGPLISIRGIAPDFSIIAVVLLGLSLGAGPATGGGFLIGLIQDLSNPPLLGLHALCKCLLGFSIGTIRPRLVFGVPVMEVMLIGLSVIAHDFLFLLVQSQFSDDGFIIPLLTQTLPVALYSGLIGVLLQRFMEMVGILKWED
jgi:rod shape-determining protein MreD